MPALAQPVLPVPKQAGTSGATPPPDPSIAAALNTIGASYVDRGALQAAAPSSDARFGYAVALSGDRALVSAPDETNGGSSTQGAAYVYDYSAGSGWTQTAKLVPNDIADGDRFGIEVALDGDRAIVGANHEFSGGAGAAYVFDLVGGAWVETQKLTAPSPANGARFGHAVALDGDRAVVGEWRRSSNRGAAYVFDLAAGSWTASATLNDPAAPASGRFGIDVELDGDRIAVGANSDSGAGAANAGAAYVFDLVAGAWTQTQKLAASDAAQSAFFGEEVALDGDRLAVGAKGTTTNATADGAVYVFDLGGGAWTQSQKLTANTFTFGFLGSGLDLSGDRLIAAAPLAQNRGRAFVFELASGSWSVVQEIAPPSGTASNARFGERKGVAVSGDRVVIGISRNAVGAQNQAGTAQVYERLSVVSVSGPEGWRQVAAAGDAETFGSYLDAIWTQGFPGSDAPSAAPNAYLYDEAADGDEAVGYTPVPSAAAAFAPGAGAFVYVYADDNNDAVPDPFPKPFALFGAEPARPFAFPLTYTDNGDGGPDVGVDAEDDGWNLLGNPFRTPFDYDAVWSAGGTSPGGTSTHIDPFVYVYSPASGYAVYNAGTNTGTLTDGLVPVGSGFYVRANAAGPQLSVAGGTGGNKRDAEVVAPHVLLRVAAETPAGAAISGAAVAALVDGASVGRDGDDARLLRPVQTPFVQLGFAPADTAAYVHASLPGPADLDRVTEIPVALGADGVGTQATVSWELDLPDGWTAELVDRAAGTAVAMEPGGQHPLADLPRVVATDRFALRLTRPAATSAEGGPPQVAVSAVAPNPVRGRAEVTVRPAAPGRVRATLLDALGREVETVFDRELRGETRLALDTRGLAPGVYVLQVRGDGFVETRRLTVVR